MVAGRCESPRNRFYLLVILKHSPAFDMNRTQGASRRGSRPPSRSETGAGTVKYNNYKRQSRMKVYYVINSETGYDETFYSLTAAKLAMKKNNATGYSASVRSNGGRIRRRA